MKRLFLLLTFLVLILSVIPLTFAQGDSITNAVPTLSEEVNQLLQQGSESIEVGALVSNDTFVESGGWELFEGEEAYLRLDEGTYEVYAPRPGIMWGNNNQVHQDVVIRAEAETLRDHENDGYGLMCRGSAGNDYDGYHFWVSGDGFAAIIRVLDGEYEEIVDWKPAINVRRGAGTNVLTVVCVGNYLAFYANQNILLETYDDTFTQGVAGVSGSSFIADNDLHVRYDNVRVWSVGEDVEIVENGGASIRDLATDPEALLPQVNRLLQQGTETVQIAGLESNETFDEATDEWFTAEFRTSAVLIEDSVYHLTIDGSDPDVGLIFGENATSHDDVVIQVTTRNLQNTTDSYAAVVCRAIEGSDFLTGYVFWVGSSGFYIIVYSDENGTDELTEFERSNAINLGAAENEITVVCSGNYLALYVNGELLAEVEDDRHHRGLAVFGATYLADEGTIDVTFDDVFIWDVEQ